MNSSTTSPDFTSAPNTVRTDKDLNVKDLFVVNNTDVVFRRGQIVNRTAFSTLLTGSVYTTAATDFLLAITNLSYAPSVGLPRPRDVGAGKTYIVKDEVGGAGTTTITVRSAAEETIDGAATSTLTTNYQSRRYYSDGSNWFTF